MMDKSEVKKKKEYHSKRYNFYKDKEKEAEKEEKKIGFRFRNQ